MSRSNSRSQSRAPSNANSRDPSPRNSLQAQSDQPADSSLGSTEGSRKRLSVAKKTVAADRKSTDPKTKTASSSKAPPKGNTDAKALLTKKPPSFRRNAPVTTSSRKETSTAAKTKKETSASVLKREPSNVKKIPSVKREKSTLKKETITAGGSNLKREPSNLAKKAGGSTLKRQSSKLMIAAAMSKSKSDVTKKLEKKNSFKKEKTDVATAQAAVPDVAANVTDTAAATDTERDPSLMSQDSNGTASDKLVAMTKSNVVSMTTAAITAQPVQISTAVTNQTTLTKSSSSNQLTKTDSSGQLLAGEMGADVRDAILQTPATILEMSQKTLENIQKTVTEATDEIQKTIEENLTDLKSLENDMKMVETGQMPTPFEKRESQRTLKSMKSEKNGSDEKTDGGTKPTLMTTTASPIEAKVSVIDGGSSSVSGSNGLKLTAQDSDERVSVRSIAMLPEVELDSGNNVDNGKSRPDGKAEPDGGGDKIR